MVGFSGNVPGGRLCFPARGQAFMPSFRSTPAVVIAAARASLCSLTVTADASADETTVTRNALSNGLRVVIVRPPSTSVASVAVTYGVGNVDAPSTQPSLNEAVAEMLMHHVDGLSAGQLSQLVGALGGHSTVTAGAAHTQFVEEVPASDVSTVLRIEADRMRGFGATGSDWNVERAVFAQAASGTEAAYEHAWRAHMLNEMHHGSPLVRDPYSGAAALAHESFSAADQFRAARYVPNNATLIVTGNVDPAAVMADVQSNFGSLARRQLPAGPSLALAPPHASSTTID